MSYLFTLVGFFMFAGGFLYQVFLTDRYTTKEQNDVSGMFIIVGQIIFVLGIVLWAVSV